MKIPVVSKDCHDGNSVSFFTLELLLLTGNTLPMLVGKLSTIRLGLSVRNFRLSDRTDASCYSIRLFEESVEQTEPDK